MEFARNLFNVRSTTTNDGPNRIHIWIMATNRHLGPVSSFTRHAHDFNRSIIDFRNFLFHQTFNHFWMATANEDIDTSWVIFYLVNKHFDAIMRLENLTWNLILFRQLRLDCAKIDIDKAIVKTFHRTTHNFIFMFFISIISDGACLLAHFFHDRLFSGLRCNSAKFSRSFFKLDLISQLIS